MKNKNNLPFNHTRINQGKSYQEKALNSNLINLEYQTTDPSSTNFQDIFQKQKKLNEDLATLSTNLNINNEQNENTISYTNSNKNNFNQIPTSSHNSKNRINLIQNMQENHDKNVNSIKIERQKDKLDELINKFNNLYSSESDIKTDDYYTLRNIDLSHRRKDNYINSTFNNSNDKINSRHLYQKYNSKTNNSKDLINKSSDDLNFFNKRIKNKPRGMVLNHIQKHHTDLIPNNKNNNRFNYNRNIMSNKPRSSVQSLNKKRIKSNSSNQISKDNFKAIRDKKLLNDYYSNTNLDNDTSELSTMSLKANMVINEFKKTLLEAEKIESELNKSKYSLNTYQIDNNTTNDIFNINNNLNLNQTKTDINNSQNSFFNPNNNMKIPIIQIIPILLCIIIKTSIIIS